jgi:hypothetical protein
MNLVTASGRACLFLCGLFITLNGCGGAAKILPNLSIEELKPVPGILESGLMVKGRIASMSGDQVYVDTGERAPRVLSLEAGGEEARGLKIGDPVEILLNDRNEVVAYQRPSPIPPTKILRASLGNKFKVNKERVTIRLETGRDVGFYARSVAMEKLAELEVGETADFAIDRFYLIVDCHSLGKPRDLPLGSSPQAPQRRVEGAFVTIGDGRVRLRVTVDDIVTFSVRPLLQPALEQLAPNEVVWVYLDGQGQVIDMARVRRS